MSPPPVKPILGELELPLVQQVNTLEERALAKHSVPGRDGAVFQNLGRRPTVITLTGELVGERAQDRLAELRQNFQNREPLSFVADIMTATEVQQVLIADLQVQELAGKSERFAYRLTLKEYIPPPPEETEAMLAVNNEVASEAANQNDARVEEVTGQRGAIEVEVMLATGERDFGIAEVEVEGTTDDGEPFSAVIGEQVEGLFRLENVPAGQYTVTAVRRE